MLTLQHVQRVDGTYQDVTIPSADTHLIDARGLTLFPGLIDPHVHFRIPGQAHKEDWSHAALASLRGGYTTVFDMPNNVPACVSLQRLRAKQSEIDAQLAHADIALRYHLYLGADKQHFHEIVACKQDIIGIKVFMGSTTGDLLMDDDSSLHAIFALAAAHDLLVAVHAEDECLIQTRQQTYAGQADFALHSTIRSPQVAAAAVAQAIDLVRLYGTRLYVLHVSTQEEITLIAAAKQQGLPVFAETTPHHLFLHLDAYAHLGALAQVNPPLRDASQQAFLLRAIHDGIIDTVGSDHAPHTLLEKQQPYGKAPSGMPGIETNLPLLLNAHHQGLLSLAEIVRLTHTRPREIFGLAEQAQDAVLVDLQQQRTVSNAHLATKCGWSAFAGQTLTGWPVCTILNGRLYDFR